MKTQIGHSRRSRWLLVLCGICATAVLTTVFVQSPQAQSARAAPLRVPSISGPVSFADVVETVRPAVVNIAVEKVNQIQPTGMPGFGNQGTPFDDFFGRFFGAPGRPGLPGGPGMPREQRSQALGSGFVIDADGYIVTNHHVIADADKVVVILEDGDELSAEVIGYDTPTDLALLKVDSDQPLAFVGFGDSDTARVGDWVLAIGNPFGLGGSATAGIISARGRNINAGNYDDYLQIDAPINSGNSGGPVFNGAGQVIGVNTAIYSPNGGNVGIGFAIPALQAKAVIDELRTEGAVTRGWLGVQIQSLDDDLASALGVDRGTGALVAEVVLGGPAALAGVEAGDVIVRIGDETIDEPRQLSRLVAAVDPGDRIEIAVIRDGRERQLDVTLGDLDRGAAVAGDIRRGPGTTGSEGLGGMQLSELTAAQRARLKIPEDVLGVLVTAVEPGSAAAEKGIRPGDVISEVNNQSVQSVRDAYAAFNSAKRAANDRALLVVRRGDTRRYVALGLS